MSCLARQAEILREEAKGNNLDLKVRNARARWYTCGLCEQKYHGIVYCALGWVCWKTYLGRPEENQLRCLAMMQLGNGLSAAGHYKDALSVREADLSSLRRLGAPEYNIVVLQTNLANSYQRLGRLDEALRTRQDVYSAKLKLYGEEDKSTLLEAYNYATSYCELLRFQEAKALMLKTIPVARRVLGEGDLITIKMKKIYARSLYEDDAATLNDLREAVTTLAETERTARRVFLESHIRP